MQKIRTLHGDLMTLSYSQPGHADPLVTRRVSILLVILLKILKKLLSEILKVAI